VARRFSDRGLSISIFYTLKAKDSFKKLIGEEYIEGKLRGGFLKAHISEPDKLFITPCGVE